jgi:predicted nucleic acid-binding protein
VEEFFIDTGFLIALESSDDRHHQTAQNCWREIIALRPIFFTTSYVFDETVTYFNSRGRHDKAVEVGNRLLNSSSTTFIHVDESYFDEGWKYFKMHQDKSYSLTDCISFIVMNQFSIQKALTFDKHFGQAGFEGVPRVNQ